MRPALLPQNNSPASSPTRQFTRKKRHSPARSTSAVCQPERKAQLAVSSWSNSVWLSTDKSIAALTRPAAVVPASGNNAALTELEGVMKLDQPPRASSVRGGK
jgi:hypothetical protein